MCKATVWFRGSVWEVYIWPEELVTVEPNLGQEEICFWAQPTLSLERRALVWNHPFPFQPEFLQARNGNQTPFLTKNLEIPQTHSSNAPPSVSHGWHKIPLYHSSFSLYELRWILLLFLAHAHAIPCTTSLRPSLSRMSQDFFLLGVLQTVSSSLRRPCPWHATQAPWEQKLSWDRVQASGVLARRLATGTPRAGICPAESAELVAREQGAAAAVMCICGKCLVQWKYGFEMPDLNLWEAEAVYQLHFSKKKVNKTPWFLFPWGRRWWQDPPDGLAAGLHEGVIFTGN